MLGSRTLETRGQDAYGWGQAVLCGWTLRRGRESGGRVRDPLGLGSDTAGDLSPSAPVPDRGRLLGPRGHGCSREPRAICCHWP